jgi:hypothetical protein
MTVKQKGVENLKRSLNVFLKFMTVKQTGVENLRVTEPYKNPEAKAARRLAEQKVAGLMLELTLLRQEIGELQ